jgi:hypothetical protein
MVRKAAPGEGCGRAWLSLLEAVRAWIAAMVRAVAKTD